MADKITVLWLYPDILNLHGDRGNLMALERIGKLMELPVEVRRWTSSLIRCLWMRRICWC